MRAKLFVLALAVLTQVGCATGFRVGGDHYGAGVGGYVGPVPESVRSVPSYSSPVIVSPNPDPLPPPAPRQ